MSYLRIGIMGGMGPEATLSCFESIIHRTPAEKDQEHLPVIIDNNPQIPDRTEAILSDGEDPVPYLGDSAKRLENAGADLIIIPCNTAHYFIEDIEDLIDIPVLNMIESTVNELPSGSLTGLLASTGTIGSGLYQEYAKGDVGILTPEDDLQEKVMNVIYGEKGIKAGYKGKRLKKELLDVVDHLKERGAGSIIAGCTEIRLVLSDSDIEGMDLFRPIDVIVTRAIDLARTGEIQ